LKWATRWAGYPCADEVGVWLDLVGTELPLASGLGPAQKSVMPPTWRELTSGPQPDFFVSILEPTAGVTRRGLQGEVFHGKPEAFAPPFPCQEEGDQGGCPCPVAQKSLPEKNQGRGGEDV